MESSWVAPIPIRRVGVYGVWRQLKDVLEAFCRARAEAPQTLAKQKTSVRQRAAACRLSSVIAEGDDFDAYVGRLYHAVVDLGNMSARAGLAHQPLHGAPLTAYIVSRVRFAGKAPSLLRLLATEAGMSLDDLTAHCSRTLASGETYGQALERLEAQMTDLVDGVVFGGLNPKAVKQVMATDAVQRMSTAGRQSLREIFDYILTEVVPTAREREGAIAQKETITAMTEPYFLPTRKAWARGQRLGDALVRRFMEDTERYPETVALVLSDADMAQRGGESLAEALYLMGVRPVWDEVTDTVKGVERIPLHALKRPCIDVLVFASDPFLQQWETAGRLLQHASSLVGQIEDAGTDNALARHVVEDLQAACASQTEAQTRLFTTLSADTELSALARVLQRALARVDVVVLNTCAPDANLLDAEAVSALESLGAVLAVCSRTIGKMPLAYVGDSTDPESMHMRRLETEMRRLFWGELVHPAFLDAMRASGVDGARALSDALVRLCRFDDSTKMMDNWMYEMMARIYVLNKASREWFRKIAPTALRAQCASLLQAIEHGRWQARENHASMLRNLVDAITKDRGACLA